MMWILLRYELLGLWRRRRFLVLAGMLFIFGALGPLSMRYLPEILSQVPGTPEGIEAVLPQADTAMALAEFGQNMTQFGALMVVLVTMGAIVQERERGTVIMVLSKPVSRAAFLGAKYIAHALLLLFGLVVGAVAGYYYLGVLFQWLPLPGFAAYIAAIYTYWLIIAGLTFLAGVWARSQMAVAGISLGLLFAASLIGLIPKLKLLMPTAVLNWTIGFALGTEATPIWGAVAIMISLVVCLPLLAWFSFRQQEL